ncbi:Bgt-2726 [Blumeria graminis f. sp. tritici]|uniref:Bgt-2726 n=2 Tax=Blumeria graminis f. sp. tritici TaxID=62690 RepID=A0A381LEG5_BLUGR|nr:hypothetical protein BGT96224_2726 [Blumeria graminis f. sp. tritici 96224]VDB90805.1 Bgt-2726 [Blumeria graminis f. sp. tritici]
MVSKSSSSSKLNSSKDKMQMHRRSQKSAMRDYLHAQHVNILDCGVNISDLCGGVIMNSGARKRKISR